MTKTVQLNIDLDIERINGFLDAIGCANQEGEVYSDYTFVQLPKNATLLGSVSEHILKIYEKHPIDYWHLSLEQIDLNTLKQGIEKWFFLMGRAESLAVFSNFVNHFMDLLAPFLASASIYRLNMIPPVFYAIDWAEFVISGKQGDYLLYFNFSD